MSSRDADEMTMFNLIALASGSVLAISFSNQVTLGSAMVMGIVGVAAIVNILGGGRKWKDLYASEKERSAIYYERSHEYAIAKNEAERKLHQLEVECAQLRERPNFEEMMTLLRVQDQKATDRIVTAVDTMLERIDERFKLSDERHAKQYQQISLTLTRTAEALERLGRREAA